MPVWRVTGIFRFGVKPAQLAGPVKLNSDNLKKAIVSILDGSKEKQRKFLETVELQVGLKDYDTQRDKRFAGTIKLPHVPRPRMKICVLGDAVHCEQAQRVNIPFKSVEDLKKLNKNKKMVKKLALSFDAFLASQVRWVLFQFLQICMDVCTNMCFYMYVQNGSSIGQICSFGCVW